jgi:hypothetical protein
MSARTLTLRSALIVHLADVRYSLCRSQAHPLATPHVPTFQALRQDWKDVHAIELTLLEAIAAAQAKLDAAHYDIHDFNSRFSKVVLTITKDDRKHPTYIYFFSDATLSDFNQFALGKKLRAMKTWLPVLSTSDLAPLKAMAPELAKLLTATDEAVEAKFTARQQNRQFRDVGERKRFVDKLNGVRKEVYGMLAKLPYTQPGLPTDFADQFFRSASAEDDKEEETVTSVKARIAELAEEMKEQQARLAELEAEEAEATQKASEIEADKEALAALEKEMATAEAKAAALRAKIGKQ